MLYTLLKVMYTCLYGIGVDWLVIIVVGNVIRAQNKFNLTVKSRLLSISLFLETDQRSYSSVK